MLLIIIGSLVSSVCNWYTGALYSVRQDMHHNMRHFYYRCVWKTRNKQWWYVITGFLTLIIIYVQFCMSPKDVHGPELRLKLSAMQHIFPMEISMRDLRLNADLSNRIGLFREPLDTRHELCKSIEYDSTSLPTASVVIPFYNEIWSVLLRTVTGILLRSPPHLIKEIILVDDASTFDFLGELLEYFVSETPKTKLVRHKTRQGLVRTRMSGAKVATGDVLIFMDGHIEVETQWLEPLLRALQENPRALFTPVIEVINADTLEWSYKVQVDYTGVFTWDFVYIWMDVPDKVKRQYKTLIDDIPTSTVLGSALAVDKKVFFELGGFDEGLVSVWGAENIETAWRYWMCGGGAYVIQCSRMGHIFRRGLPYAVPDSYEKNYQRAAELWMGEYLPFYYASIHNRYPRLVGEQQSLDERKQFIAGLNCHSFQWYLDTVLPDMFLPWRNATMQGTIENLSSGECLLVNNDGSIGNGPCSKQDRRMYFFYTEDRRLFHNNTHCILPRTNDGPVHVARCTSRAVPEQQWNLATDIKKDVRDVVAKMPWKVNKSVLVRIESSVNGVAKCLTLALPKRGRAIAQSWPCNDKDTYAHWYLTYNMDFSV